MRKTLGILIRFNLTWGIIFLVFQTILIGIFENDGKLNSPYSVDEYLEKGGNHFDYIAGYAFLTSNDATYDGNTTIIGRSYKRFWYFIVYISAWLYGFWSLFRFKVHFCPDANDLKRSKDLNQKIPTVKGRHYLGSLLVTLISLYGIYYCFVYVIKFWLK